MTFTGSTGKQHVRGILPTGRVSTSVLSSPTQGDRGSVRSASGAAADRRAAPWSNRKGNPVNILEELTRRREEIKSEHKAAVERLEIQYKAKIGEIDRIEALASTGTGSSAQASRTSRRPGSRAKPAAAKPTRRRPTSTTPPQAQADKNDAPPAAEAGEAVPSQRKADDAAEAPATAKPKPSSAKRAAPEDREPTLRTLIDKRIVSVLVRDGQMSTAAMEEISGAKKFGPVVSGWKRRTRGLGIDLDTLLVRNIDKATGKVVYKITPEGKDALQPGADVSR